MGRSIDVRNALGQRVLRVEVGGVWDLYILEGGVVGNDIDGVDEFEAVIDLGEFLERGQIEEG